MSTPRKHWFKVADSIVRKLTIEQRGMLVSLMSVMNSRWARDGLRGEEAGRIVLSHGELVTITGRSQVRFALKSLRSLAEVTSISVSLEGDFIEISWPKFAIFQGMASESRVAAKTDAVSAVPPPQDAPARRKTQDAEKKKSAAPPLPATAPRRVTSPAPERLSDEELVRLADWCCESEPTQAHRVEELTAACLDHFRGEGKRKADWVATCRNWIRKDRQFRERGGGGRSNGIRPGPISQAVRNIVARDEARDRAGAQGAHSDARQVVRAVPRRGD